MTSIHERLADLYETRERQVEALHTLASPGQERTDGLRVLIAGMGENMRLKRELEWTEKQILALLSNPALKYEEGGL